MGTESRKSDEGNEAQRERVKDGDGKKDALTEKAAVSEGEREGERE